MYKLKEAAKRGVAFAGAVGMLAGISTTAFPALVSADALNPLTERSLMLTSSSPGWAYTDGSNNPTYAPPGSGPNGQKTGETFSFRVSSTNTIKAFTFQYCTTAAGNCTPPGNGTVAASEQSNLDIVYPSPVEDTDYNVYMGDATEQAMTALTADSGWTMAASRVVDAAGATTTENNFITLTNATGLTPGVDYQFYIDFNASETHYITNPGAGAFFVRMNTFDSDTLQDETTKIDGGVTVANVMNESIHITTKVLETMSFSVGTENPDNVAGSHGTCDPIVTNDQIELGDPSAEFSLSTLVAYDATSYWRLSTNSSGGATVYYSGATLNNTVGDNIDGMTSEDISHYGTEQFGLAVDATPDTPDAGAPASSLLPLVAETGYDEGQGTINEANFNDNTAKFNFATTSLTNPVAIASHDDAGIDCSTGKMRYIANIAANTPAGVYTTKINYIAAPRY